MNLLVGFILGLYLREHKVAMEEEVKQQMMHSSHLKASEDGQMPRASSKEMTSFVQDVQQIRDSFNRN